MFLVRLGQAKAMRYFDLVTIAKISSVFGEIIEYMILFGESFENSISDSKSFCDYIG